MAACQRTDPGYGCYMTRLEDCSSNNCQHRRTAKCTRDKLNLFNWNRINQRLGLRIGSVSPH